MKIKKKHNNEYFLTQDSIWVRNFTKNIRQVDINKLTQGSDYQLILENELCNRNIQTTHIDKLEEHRPYCVIVSDGYKFLERQEFLSKLKKDITIIGVNGTLSKWNLSYKRNMSFYITNNPYPECMKFLPSKHKYYPRCIASTRTYPGFLHEYKGYISTYVPVPQIDYQTPSRFAEYKIDDYRNPICAAISLAYRFGVQKLLLYCCDDSFEDYRPAAIQLENNLWNYHQQMVFQKIIDANLYWLKLNKIQIGNYSSGIKYSNAKYINSEDEVFNFFTEENNGF